MVAPLELWVNWWQKHRVRWQKRYTHDKHMSILFTLTSSIHCKSINTGGPLIVQNSYAEGYPILESQNQQKSVRPQQAVSRSTVMEKSGITELRFYVPLDTNRSYKNGITKFTSYNAVFTLYEQKL